MQSGLLEALDAQTPVAVIQHASLPQQRNVVCSLIDLASTIARERLGSPAIIIVGDVLRGALAVAMADASRRAA